MLKTAIKNVSNLKPAFSSPVDRTRETLAGVRHALEKVEQQAKLHRHRISDFQSNVGFQFEKGRYVVKTADNGSELEACLKLRFEVFHREGMNKRRTHGVDVDKLDLICDHLAIIDSRTQQTIGTYRLNCSKFTGQFYSAGEFDMGRLLELPGHKLELGRACIDKDHRNGVVIALLWRGIAEYLTRTESSYLFGCASIKTTDAPEIALVHAHLIEKGLIDDGFGVEPTKKFRVKKLAQSMAAAKEAGSSLDAEAAKALIPTLFTSYVRMGAKFLGEPALDRDFQCIDYLTLLKMDELNPLFSRKYNV